MKCKLTADTVQWFLNFCWSSTDVSVKPLSLVVSEKTDLSTETEHFFLSAVNHEIYINIRYGLLVSVGLPQM